MKQAKVLTERELKVVLAVVGTMKHAARNRAALMLSHYAGMRVGEIAALTVGDVLTSNGEVKEQVLLRAATTKTGEARAVFVSDKLRQELERYVAALKVSARPASAPFLLTQKRTAFSGNTLCQLFTRLYSLAGIDGASSHSGRRWFITRLAHSGVSAKVIMTLAGHKHLTTTQRYIEVNDEMLRAAVRKLP
ncbi:MAG: site-specific integrase [Magnetospirillum sp.]|nr:site-specific integrase [Magnetospirillum sp.]